MQSTSQALLLPLQEQFTDVEVTPCELCHLRNDHTVDVALARPDLEGHCAKYADNACCTPETATAIDTSGSLYDVVRSHPGGALADSRSDARHQALVSSAGVRRVRGPVSRRLRCSRAAVAGCRFRGNQVYPAVVDGAMGGASGCKWLVGHVPDGHRNWMT